MYIVSIGSGGSSFGEENPPLDPLTLVIGGENPPPTDRIVSLGQNWVKVEQFGQFGKCWLGLDALTHNKLVTPSLIFYFQLIKQKLEIVSLVSFLPFVIIVYLGGKNKLNEFGIQSENNNQMHKNKNNISITS